MTIPVRGKITHRWNEPRPLTVPPGQRTMIHAGVDFKCDMGEEIRALKPGKLFRFALIRPNDKAGPWRWPLRFARVPTMPWGNHFHDIYGAVTVLDTNDGCVHLFCHSYIRQLWESEDFERWEYQEEPADTRWPVMLWHTFGSIYHVDEGETIARVGSAGMSDGPHLHWEIHLGWNDTPRNARPDPEAYLGA